MPMCQWSPCRGKPGWTRCCIAALRLCGFAEALRPLRDDGVLVVGSGMSFHNLRQFKTPAAADGGQRRRW